MPVTSHEINTKMLSVIFLILIISIHQLNRSLVFDVAFSIRHQILMVSADLVLSLQIDNVIPVFYH